MDALIGYGLHGDPRGVVADWIRWANRAPSPILSLDTPSGLDTTTGSAGHPCVRATATLTLALPKTGLVEPAAKEFVGDLFVADISVPPQLFYIAGKRQGLFFPSRSRLTASLALASGSLV